MRKIILFLYCMSFFIYEAVAADRISTIFSKKTVSIDIEIIHSANFRSAVSSDNKYVAFYNLLDKDKGLAKLTVYDTNSGLLVAERSLNSISASTYERIQFLPDNKTIFLDGFHGEKGYFWNFKESTNVVRTCWNGSLGYVVDSSRDGASILYKTYDARIVLCGSSRLKDERIFTERGVGESKISICNICGGDSRIVIDGNKILVLYNFGSKGAVRYRSSGKPIDDSDRAFWNVDYFSNLPYLNAFFDKKRGVVYFIESGNGKLKTKLLKYKERKILESLNVDLSLSPSDFINGDDFILIKSKDGKVALLEKSLEGLKLKWVKNVSTDFLDKIEFREDGVYFTRKKIVFVDFVVTNSFFDPKPLLKKPDSSLFAVVMDIETGELESYSSELSLSAVKPLDANSRFLHARLPEKYLGYIFDTRKNELFESTWEIESISDDRSVLLVRESNTKLDIWRTID